MKYKGEIWNPTLFVMLLVCNLVGSVILIHKEG